MSTGAWPKSRVRWKAQGSADPAGVIPLVTQHWSMLRRNLVYTAITRGKRLVATVGQPKALVIAVKGEPEDGVTGMLASAARGSSVGKACGV
jgi:hypothetical protein